ncbi:MAG TPA: type II toxin-antitoxin system VapC family toxin [Chloroflexota bacterium]|nr:type II toxin-antitoxin system VapC family toxin [Chloroflexota bacterium]
MTERPTGRPHVLDASVAVSWLLRLPDEAHGAHAERLVAERVAGRVHLVGPPHLTTDVGSALLKAVRCGRITPERGRTLMEQFRRLRVRELPADPAMLAAWDFAHRFGCSYHDAGYLALADLLGCPFVHADDKLRDKLAGQFPHEVWIEDYRPAAV